MSYDFSIKTLLEEYSSVRKYPKEMTPAATVNHRQIVPFTACILGLYRELEPLEKRKRERLLTSLHEGGASMLFCFPYYSGV